MGRARRPKPVILFCGLLSADPDLLARARQLLARRFGPPAETSDVWEFDFTDYYATEMGAGLKRLFVAFQTPIDPQRLAEVKHETNALEAHMAEQCAALELARPVNIDPGYVDHDKLVLATTKDAPHRLCLGANLYGEITLTRRGGEWVAWPWTYPDFRDPRYQAFFTTLLTRLRRERRDQDADATGPPPEAPAAAEPSDAPAPYDVSPDDPRDVAR
jgi:hypothetical protein